MIIGLDTGITSAVSNSTLNDRRQALEDRFFRDLEAKKIEEMQASLAKQKASTALAAVSGIEDQQVLEALVAQDVGASDLSALVLVPLVRVAWADGAVSDSERDAVLQAAKKSGVESGSHGFELLEQWLKQVPDESLYTAWNEYVVSLKSHISSKQMENLRDSILGLAHDVASAAGGILGVLSVSHNEKKALEDLTKVFDS